MIKNYIQIGPYAFIEKPDKQKADKMITDLGIGTHKWTETDIKYGFSRYGERNEFIINFFISVGFHYHIYNVFVEAIEAECCGVTTIGGEFWKDNIAGKGYKNENIIKPQTDYVVVKILVCYPLQHISEILEYHDKERSKLSTRGVVTTFSPSGPINTYLGKEIGRAMTSEQISNFLTDRYNFHLTEYCNCLEYLEKITPLNKDI